MSICLLIGYISFLFVLSLSKSTSQCNTINTWGYSNQNICNNDDIIDGFNNQLDKYHCYYFTFKICEDTIANCTQQLVFDVMLSNATFLAPTDTEKEVTDCTDLMLNTIPYRFNWSNRNPVKTTVEDNQQGARLSIA